jgi:hypothetical protein
MPKRSKTMVLAEEPQEKPKRQKKVLHENTGEEYTNPHRLNFRTGPSINDSVIMVLPPNTTVAALDDGEVWIHVELVGTEEHIDGFVQKQFLRKK